MYRVNAVRRYYEFPQEVVTEVQSSLKFDAKGYKSIKAVCSDGKIRVIKLFSGQHRMFLVGEVNINHRFPVGGWVDTTRNAYRYSNTGVVFMPDPKGTNYDLLPWWDIPIWYMPTH